MASGHPHSSRRKPRAPGPAPFALQLTLVGHADHAGLPARPTLRRWVQLALQGPAQLALVFVDARKGRALNREFRGRDYATNVLTFAYQAPGELAAPRRGRAPRALDLMADIVLCVPVLRREAREQGITLRAHLAHLVLHGVLHAQGHDHERLADARRMQALETALLGRLRIADPYS